LYRVAVATFDYSTTENSNRFRLRFDFVERFSPTHPFHLQITQIDADTISRSPDLHLRYLRHLRANENPPGPV